MKNTSVKQQKRSRRQSRIRTKIKGTAERPRLAVFRSNKSIYGQLIDDEAGKTIAAADSRKLKGATMQERAVEVGKLLAELAKQKKIEKVVFDRGGYQYKGIVVALADGARNAGLVF